ncbi:hypothetical protein [Rickettsia argasii]|uniref:Uncharacterized protein n=1 Tax=Rickettsia argasii T170-B TaxID=1268837 RepID=A0A0F3RG77_9RICK|nr:hypothetical protein [Rickettsia argasii]KJW05112.1 hypothetical protein RAT170B_0815 [Rickettsia argasii T170-B]
MFLILRLKLKKPNTGSRLEHTPSKSGIFRTFALEGLDEETSLGCDIKIFDSEL